MKGINIDEANRLVINPFGFNLDNFKVAEAKTQAPDVQNFNYKEPVVFGTACFGDPDAFNRLQEIVHARTSENEMPTEEVVEDQAPVLEEPQLPAEPSVELDQEPAFC